MWNADEMFEYRMETIIHIFTKRFTPTQQEACLSKLTSLVTSIKLCHECATDCHKDWDFCPICGSSSWHDLEDD